MHTLRENINMDNIRIQLISLKARLAYIDDLKLSMNALFEMSPEYLYHEAHMLKNQIEALEENLLKWENVYEGVHTNN